MTFLRTKGTGNFKVTNNSAGAYLRCRYDASEKAENETPPAENETPPTGGPFYYDVHLTGSFAFQAALTEIDMYDIDGNEITIKTSDITDVYSGNGFLTNISAEDLPQLFDGVTNPVAPLEYYHNFASGTPPEAGFKLFRIETQLPVHEVHVHYNMWGNKPGDGSWNMRVIIDGVAHTISEFGNFVSPDTTSPAIISII